MGSGEQISQVGIRLGSSGKSPCVFETLRTELRLMGEVMSLSTHSWVFPLTILFPLVRARHIQDRAIQVKEHIVAIQVKEHMVAMS